MLNGSSIFHFARAQWVMCSMCFSVIALCHLFVLRPKTKTKHRHCYKKKSFTFWGWIGTWVPIFCCSILLNIFLRKISCSSDQTTNPEMNLFIFKQLKLCFLYKINSYLLTFWSQSKICFDLTQTNSKFRNSGLGAWCHEQDIINLIDIWKQF